MRPDDRAPAFGELADSSLDLPFDADLESLDRELAAAGEHARRTLYGRSQPTRLFSNALRGRLLGAVEAPIATRGTAETGSRAPEMEGEVRAQAWTGRSPRRATPTGEADEPAATASPRAILALLVIVSMAAVLGVVALGTSLGPALP
jgi:hypothetical protein